MKAKGNKMDTNEVIRKLKKHADIFEVYHKITFSCFRTNKEGNPQAVEVEILDAGPDVNPNIRYHCVAKTEDGKMATGNPAESLSLVLTILHWEDLDK